MVAEGNACIRVHIFDAASKETIVDLVDVVDRHRMWTRLIGI